MQYPQPRYWRFTMSDIDHSVLGVVMQRALEHLSPSATTRCTSVRHPPTRLPLKAEHCILAPAAAYVFRERRAFIREEISHGQLVTWIWSRVNPAITCYDVAEMASAAVGLRVPAALARRCRDARASINLIQLLMMIALGWNASRQAHAKYQRAIGKRSAANKSCNFWSLVLITSYVFTSGRLTFRAINYVSTSC